MTRNVRYSKPLVIRLTPEMRQILDARAKELGQRLSEYVRDMIRKQTGERKAQ